MDVREKTVTGMAEYIEREAAIKELMNDAPEQVGYFREDTADCKHICLYYTEWRIYQIECVCNKVKLNLEEKRLRYVLYNYTW